MTDTLYFEDVAEARRQEIVKIIRENTPLPIGWVWSKNKQEDKYTRDIIGVTMDSEDLIVLRLKFAI